MIDMLSPKLIFLVTAWSAFSIAAISPGPNMLAVMERAFGAGRDAAIGVAMGIACGSFLCAITTTMGLGYFANEYPIIISIVGIVGGGYFLTLGITRYRYGRKKVSFSSANPVHSSSLRGDMLHGMLVILSNPKVFFFWVSLSVLIAQADLNNLQIFFFAGTCALTALSIYVFEAFLFSMNKARNIYDKSQHVIDIGFSALFSLIGIYLVWFGVRFIFG